MRSILLSVVGEFFKDDRHLGSVKQHRFAQLAGTPVLLAQFLQVDGQGQRFVEIAAGDEQAVVGEQAGLAVAHGEQGGIRQRL